MKIFKENIIYILLILVNMLFSFDIIKQSYLIVDYEVIYIFAIFLLSVAVYCLFNSIVKTTLNKLMIILAGALVIVIYGYFNSMFINFSNDIQANINTISSGVANASATYFEQYKLFFILTIPILVFLFLYLAGKGFGNIGVLFTTGIISLFWGIGFRDVVKANIKWCIPIILISLAVNNSFGEMRRLKKNKYKFKHPRGKVVFLAILPAIFISFLVINLPRDYEGSYHKKVKGAFLTNYSSEKTTGLGDNAYGLDNSGYSDSSEKLGGSININNDLVLKVKANKSEYLRGIIKDLYTGSMWKRSSVYYGNKVKGQENLLGSKPELLSALNNPKTMTVYPANTKTSSVFTPMYTYNVNLDKGTVYYDGIPTFIADFKKSLSYKLNYYDTKETENFENCKEVSWLNEDKNLQGAYNFGDMYSKYLQLPNTITNRTMDLQHQITTGNINRFEDIEKIQRYLSKTFPYTLNVSDDINSDDFVDDFLFNEKKGYCVYFATAATVLCRLSGIPARYVEGFKMPESKNSNGLYEVTNANAHAWCEVLVDPEKGLWSVLEATPGTLASTTTANNPATDTPDTVAALNPSTPANNKAEKGLDKNDTKGQTIKADETSSNSLEVIGTVFIGLLILATVKVALRIRTINKMVTSDSVIPLYKYTIRRLKQIGIVKPEHMAEMEYAQTISDFQLKVLVKKISTSLYEEFYGKKKIIEIDKALLYKDLEKYIKYGQGKWVYFLKKYLFI